ncbi:MAG: glycosyltransferase family 4 protein [Patescibacteria group bacterium]
MNKLKKQNQSIIIAADIFPPDIGGPATYSQKVAAELKNKGWQVKLICYSDKKIKDDLGFPVYRIIRGKFAPWRYLKYFLKLCQLARGVDIIYAMGPVAAGWPASWAAKLLGKKLVVKIVGDYAWEQARNLKLTDLGIDEFQTKDWHGKTGRLKRIETRVCFKADKVITPSEYLKKIVKGWSVEENKIQVIYNAIELKTVEPILKQENERWLISVARLVPWKGIDTIIKLMPEIIKEIPNLKFIVIGDGPEKPKLQEIIHSFGLENSVRLMGLMTHGDTLKYICASDLFILNSGYEGLPHVLIEALSCNVPVVASDVGGVSEVIYCNELGLIFKYNNEREILKVILDFFKTGAKSDWLLKSKERTSFFEQFSFPNMINKTEELLKNL